MKIKGSSSYSVVIIKANDGTFAGYIEEVPGVISQGATVEETKENLLDALKMMIRFYKEESLKMIHKTHKRIHKRDTLTL
jgi:predicted RNase H-like HicB family nuclease